MNHASEPGARHRVTPLAPPAGRFDEVMAAARARRRQQRVVGASTVGVVSIVLGSGVLVNARPDVGSGSQQGTAATGTPASTPSVQPTAERAVATSAAAAPAPAEEPVPTPTKTATVRTTADLPLTTEYMWDAADNALLMQAETVLVRKCMADKGFDYKAPPPMSDEDAANLTRFAPQPYGVHDLGLASSVGYHRPDWALSQKVYEAKLRAKPGERIVKSAAGDVTIEKAPQVPDDYQAALDADGDGCLETSWRQLHDPKAAGYDVELWGRVLTAAEAAAAAHPDVVAVTDKWSSCMRAAGFDFASPAAAADAEWGGVAGAPTQKEISTATADVTCKQQAGLVDVWLDALDGEQRRLMADPANKPTLDAQQKAMNEAVERARGVLKLAS